MKKEKPLKRNRQNKGITLIALVVTIIVLIILAGVSINLILGDNGLIPRAKQAVHTSDKESVREKIQLEVLASYGEDGKLDADKLISNLKNSLGIDGTKGADEGFPVEVTLNGYSFTIDKYGTVQNAGPTVEITDKKVVLSSDGTGSALTEARSQENLDTPLYISFKARIEGGTIESVTCDNGTPELKGEIWVTQVTANGTYKFTVTGKVDGDEYKAYPEEKVNQYDNLAGLDIGSVVRYEPTGSTYLWQGKYATTATITTKDGKDTTTDDVLLDSRDNGNYRITSWKVLDIDGDTIKLVPAEQPGTTVKLQGANGYNNAVNLLNDACSTLYSSEKIEARSINIEDIEKATNLLTVKGENYPVQMKNASDTYKESGYTSYNYYPLIYEQENNSVIDGNTNSSGLGESSKADKLIERTDASAIQKQTDGETAKNATNGYIKASSSIKLYNTYYIANISSVAKNSKYSGVLTPSSNKYWVASRCVGTSLDRCNFGVRGVSSGGLYAYDLFKSNRNTYDGSHALFPVVTLSSELIDRDASGNFVVE